MSKYNFKTKYTSIVNETNYKSLQEEVKPFITMQSIDWSILKLLQVVVQGNTPELAHFFINTLSNYTEMYYKKIQERK